MRDYKILTIIPARGGSKGVKNKNIKLLGDKPLIAYSIEENKKSKYVDRVLISTDDDKIAQVASMYGAEIPFMRPSELATDTAKTIDVIIHCINWLKENENYYPDITVVTQCTSPLTTSWDIDRAIEKFIRLGCDSLTSVCLTEHHPYWMFTLEGSFMKPFMKEGQNLHRRQDLPNVYRQNGAIYIARTDGLLAEKNLEFGKISGYIMDNNKSVDIDTEIDFKLAEFLIEARNNDEKNSGGNWK